VRSTYTEAEGLIDCFMVDEQQLRSLVKDVMGDKYVLSIIHPNVFVFCCTSLFAPIVSHLSVSFFT
jgi:hypothetical protein